LSTGCAATRRAPGRPSTGGFHGGERLRVNFPYRALWCLLYK
jgi:hypothetical protein